MRRLIATLTVLPLLAAGLAACSDEPDPEYAAVCVDPNTEERLPDDYCDDDSSNYLGYAVLWYMAMNSGHPYPGVGHRVDNRYVTTKLPKGKTYTTGLPKTGGTSVKTWTTSRSGTGSGTTGGSGTTTKKPGGSFGGGSSTTRRR